MTPRVLAVGVDGARGGWLAATAFGADDGTISSVELSLVENFAGLDAMRSDTDAPMAVDIPMGLLDSVDFRPCDRGARDVLGPRRSSVFAPPSRPLLTAATYGDARALVEAERLGSPAAKSLSAQSFGIVPKIREADRFLRADPAAQDWLWECHPELSFLGLNGRVGLPPKTTVAGQAVRIRLLGARFPTLLDTLASFDAGITTAKLDDALDAFACLHTALSLRPSAGPGSGSGSGPNSGAWSCSPAFHFGEPGDVDAAGITMRIVG